MYVLGELVHNYVPLWNSAKFTINYPIGKVNSVKFTVFELPTTICDKESSASQNYYNYQTF